jgi:hypothetical protein
MATEIQVWQIVEGNLKTVNTSMVDAGRKEVDDLEKWIKSHSAILGRDISIIGQQVNTKSGFIDFLGIDKLGNLIVIELKRDRLPREVLAQAIDYASDVASWDVDKVNEVCLKFTGQRIEDHLNETFEDVDLEDMVIGKEQRILLVGFSIDEALKRMIEWLSNTYSVSINAIVLKYIQTKNREELLARTMIIPEEIEKERSQRRMRISMSDEKGNYDEEELETLLSSYLSEHRLTPRRMKNILFPLCLKHNIVTREMIKKSLIQNGEAKDDGKAGIILTTISREIGIEQRDYLRQVIEYDRPNPWEKDNYRIREEYKDTVKKLLENLGGNDGINVVGN